MMKFFVKSLILFSGLALFGLSYADNMQPIWVVNQSPYTITIKADLSVPEAGKIAPGDPIKPNTNGYVGQYDASSTTVAFNLFFTDASGSSSFSTITYDFSTVNHDITISPNFITGGGNTYYVCPQNPQTETFLTIQFSKDCTPPA